MTRLAIHGAAGRMGRRLVALAHQDNALSVAAAIDHANHPDLGADAGQLAGVGDLGVKLGDALDAAPAEALIDFSLPEGFRRALAHCVAAKLPIVVGTTGLTADDDQALNEAAAAIPVLQATNFSLVVNVMWKLAAQAAQMLEGYDIEVLEAHHRMKKDAVRPSRSRTSSANPPAETPPPTSSLPATAMMRCASRTRSPSRPSASVTTRASTPPTSPASANAWRSSTCPRAGTATRWARCALRSGLSAKRRIATQWRTCWACKRSKP